MQQMHLSLFVLLALGCSSVCSGPSYTHVSYAFAVDDTGSMGNEINAVKAGIKDLLRIAPAAVANYVVVLFNDPTIGPWIKSSDNVAIMKFIDEIGPRGGADCPELAMGGLRKAIELSDRGSFLFFFSDASAKDHHLHATVAREAKAKDIMILFVLTGCCGMCNSTQFNAYRDITAEVDGRMYQVSKTGAEEFMKYTVLVAAKDALLMKLAPTKFEAVVEIVKTGEVPEPSAAPPADDNGSAATDLNSSTATDLNGSTVALVLVSGILATVANWSLKA